MCLCLPIHSTTLRLPVPKWLKSQQSGLGQAKPANAGSVWPLDRSGGVGLRAMAGFPAPEGRHRVFELTDPLSP